MYITIDCYKDGPDTLLHAHALSQVTKIEVRRFHHKNRYIHRRDLNKKPKSPRKCTLYGYIFLKKLPCSGIPVIFVFMKNASFQKHVFGP